MYGMASAGTVVACQEPLQGHYLPSSPVRAEICRHICHPFWLHQLPRIELSCWQAIDVVGALPVSLALPAAANNALAAIVCCRMINSLIGILYLYVGVLQVCKPRVALGRAQEACWQQGWPHLCLQVLVQAPRQIMAGLARLTLLG